GPEVLVSADLVRGRRITSWPGIADDLRNAGASWEDAAVVRDGTWVSSRGPQDLPAFETAMVELFAAHAPRGLKSVPRPMHALATASRVATLGAGGLLVAGVAKTLLDSPRVGAAIARVRRQPKPAADSVAIVHELALGIAFGGIAFAKIALDPAARVLARRTDRGRMVVAPWRAFVVPSGIALVAGVATWIGGDRRRALALAPGLARTKDALLAASVLTGAVDAAAGIALSKSGDVPMESGAEPTGNHGVARTHRVGLAAGYAHLFALAGTLAVGAVLARRLMGR
ncbi:MAG TPA: DJ-1/PfpI family protein, partial [Kofleriaceae bacterium]|nr:DJ-1/PfpI family protein [Kofleriaceae bacterium]